MGKFNAWLIVATINAAYLILLVKCISMVHALTNGKENGWHPVSVVGAFYALSMLSFVMGIIFDGMMPDKP